MTAITRSIASRMTRDEFVLWDAPTPVRWQLIDGEAVEMAPASQTHSLIQSELIRLLANHLVECGSSCRVMTAPGVVPRIRADMNFRVPDVGITCAATSSGLFVEEPLILAEILSPSNETITRTNVWAYTTLPSVREILLLRSSRVEAELLRRNEDGTWPADPTIVRHDNSLALHSIGFVSPLSALYRISGLNG